MSKMHQVSKTGKVSDVGGQSGREVEVAEAIKALQTQLADLRKIVRAADSHGASDSHPKRPQ